MEKPIQTLITTFAEAITRLQTSKEGCQPTFTLSVAGNRYNDPPKITLHCQYWDGSYYQTVEAASLDTLLSEVDRRVGFADREALEIANQQRLLITSDE